MTASPPTDRVVSVVELLAARAPLHAAAIADTLELSRSTVGAILTTLDARSWVQRLPDLTYRLGPAFPHHVRPANQLAMPPNAQNALRALADRVGCGAALAAVTERSMTFVALAAPTRSTTPDHPTTAVDHNLIGTATDHDRTHTDPNRRAHRAATDHGRIPTAAEHGRPATASDHDFPLISTITGHGRIPTGIEVGTRLPLRAPAAAAVIAFSPPQRQRAWLDSADPTQRRELSTALTEIRSTGLAIWGIDPADLATLDVLAEVAGHLAHSPATGPLRRRVLGLLAGLSGYPHTLADLNSDRPLPLAYLAAPVFDHDDIPRWELQIGPLHPAVSPTTRNRYRAELLTTAGILSADPPD
ncbi:helix-turn-helix domain-containing protein [Nocardia lasii]|uniref:Helix-turn-helix domain-containing protein n=1 Tax=Nocardia lasii TaxID=1616107 RepID=A0ABW1JTC0_9NOCA